VAGEVRRAAAQALGNLHEVDARRALAEASSEEKAVDVRLEIVHALMAQGLDMRAELERIANSDSDSSVRALARTYADAFHK
jgi:HEAT repeat protein